MASIVTLNEKNFRFRADLRPALARLVDAAMAMYAGHLESPVDYPLNEWFCRNSEHLRVG